MFIVTEYAALMHGIFVQSTGMYTEMWSSGSAHIFCIRLVIFKEWKKS